MIIILANKLFHIALKDIQASRTLYERELYSQSFFCFQQAAEKANKAHGLLVGSITEKDLMKMMHQSLKIQRKQMVKIEQEIKETLDIYSHNPWLETSPISDSLNMREYHMKMQTGISSFDKLFNSDLQNISSSILEQTLSELTEMEKENLPQMPKGFTENFRIGMLKYGEWLGNNGKLSVEEKVQMHSDLNNAEMMDDVSTSLYKAMEHTLQQSKTHFIIFVCTLITTQHASSTHYPENSKDPLEMYTLKNPVVKLQPNYMALLERTFQFLLQSYDVTIPSQEQQV